MLYGLIKEVLCAHLEQLSGLAGLSRRNAPDWRARAERWLEEAETHMARFRFPEVGLVAAARGGIAKATDEPGTDQAPSRRQREKAVDAAAWQAVQETARLLTERARQAEDRLRAFEDKLCEGLTAYFLQHPPEAQTDPPAPAELWRGLKGNEATKALALYVETSLASQDREYLIVTILDNLQFQHT